MDQKKVPVSVRIASGDNPRVLPVISRANGLTRPPIYPTVLVISVLVGNRNKKKISLSLNCCCTCAVLLFPKVVNTGTPGDGDTVLASYRTFILFSTSSLNSYVFINIIFSKLSYLIMQLM